MTDIEHKARSWMEWAEAVRLTHYNRADVFRKWNNALGSASVVLSTVVSAGILTTVSKNNPSFAATVVAAVLGVVAATVTGLRTYLKLGQLSEHHRKVAADFGEIVKELELFSLAHPHNDEAGRAKLQATAAEIHKLEKAAPGYPARVFQRYFRGRQAPDIGAG